MNITEKDLARFEDKIFPEPMSGCWLWLAYVNGSGYGVFSWKQDFENTLAHRTSYEIYNGKIPKGSCVLHKCDTPCCVNPQHLFLGTQADNMKDMAKKCRRRGPFPSIQGENHPQSKLSKEDVNLIRERYKNGERQYDLADEYGVSKGTISAACIYRTWRDV